ncbi:hypothetical protein EIN_431600 [Entamoeba invadens IP1]|uniref:Right handed beta helix domain-containing protein n=1 Tax=Entamoeba invadens IP1 TaxID=370355 RepID=A0A0A1UCX4_ENTIV|nr:hypothetical protein EIN_431600 [Entamoeba invadens IP1]ELP93688.1 hypothetical protein EIN_431600 [Entamoeba invadens IP1]|eukprot:XP_004260459.1 hypothetical protein EIN_431600 [Entamoeba invadens IP1]
MQWLTAGVNGTHDKPLTIRAALNSKVIFDASGKAYAFHLENSSNIEVVGPFTARSASYLTVSAVNCTNITLSNFKVYNSTMWAILVTGFNILVKDNYAQDCVLRNENCKSTTGWEQCVATSAVSQYIPILSENITFDHNEVYHSWGEGIDIILCTNCVIKNNYVHDTTSQLFYTDNSHNILIENNVFRLTNGTLKGCKGDTNAISIGDENWAIKPISVVNITIKNNFIWGCSNGVSYWGSNSVAYYSNITVIFNTFWKIEKAALQFTNDCVVKNKSFFNQFKNNFVYSPQEYYSAAVNPNYLDQWNVSANIYYGVNRINLKDNWNGTDGNCHSIYVPLDAQRPEYFFGKGFFGNCSNERYWEPHVETYCFVPKKESVLYHKGVDATYFEVIGKHQEDYYGCVRSRVKPSIGFSEGEYMCNFDGTMINSVVVILITILCVL